MGENMFETTGSLFYYTMHLIMFFSGLILVIAGILLFKRTKKEEGKTWKVVGVLGVIIGLALMIIIGIWVMHTRNANEKLYEGYMDTGKYLAYDDGGKVIFDKEEYSVLTFEKSYATCDYRKKPVGNIKEDNAYGKIWGKLLKDGSNTLYEIENSSGYKILYDGAYLYAKLGEIDKIKEYYKTFDDCSYQLQVENITSGEMKVQLLDLESAEIVETMKLADEKKGIIKETNQGYNYFLTIVSNDGVFGIQRTIIISDDECYIGTDRFSEGDEGNETGGREYFVKINNGVSDKILEFVKNIAWG